LLTTFVSPRITLPFGITDRKAVLASVPNARSHPAPEGGRLSKGMFQAIDMDSYRAEAQAALKMVMDDADAEIQPVPLGNGGGKASLRSTNCRT